MDSEELAEEMAESEMCDNNLTSDNSGFAINMSSIPTVPQDEQNYELFDLGIDIYEQSDLERGILHQVDNCLENQVNCKNDCRLPGPSLNNTELEKSSFNKSLNSAEGMNFLFGKMRETEFGRRIRMGEITPFGTSVSSEFPDEDPFYNVKKYLQDQAKAREKMKNLKSKPSCNKEVEKKIVGKNVIIHKKDKANVRKKIKMPLMRKHLYPKMRKQKEALNIFTNIDNGNENINSEKSCKEISSSCSEYIPSECSNNSEDEHEAKRSSVRKKKRKLSKKSSFKEDELWNTDDSDWEYSDDDVCLRRKSKSDKKEQDDGDFDYYIRRLSFWEKNNNREEIESQVKQLDGGFKIPLVLWSRLFNYQKVGVQWLWELNVQSCGGILGDEMGLGKTLQVIAFLAGLSISKLFSRHGSFRGLGPVLIICPTTVMHQWIRELHFWWPQFRAALMHESGNYGGKRAALIQNIIKTKGILVTSFVSCTQHIDILTQYVWHYIILDEGHKIRNPESQVTNAVKQIKTPHRLILSGSPMQNNLKELWSLFDFIFPGKLGTLSAFMSEFAVPITQGGYTNASQVQVATAYKCATVLRDTISPYLLRRMKDDVKNHINLPVKNEQVLFCKLTDEQKKLYAAYLNSDEIDSILCGRYKIFKGLITLRKICNHPHLFTGGPKIFKWDDPDKAVPDEEKYGYWKKAGKMIVVETLLKIWKRQDHRVLIFTQSKQMLFILENFVRQQGYKYLKLDGSTSVGSRQPIIRKFNEDKSYFIFLSTTRVGGLGVNLTGADRVVIYDPDWNPATDSQARERAWRIGQMSQVTIYRLVTSGTIEEKIYHRQIFKLFLTNKVLKYPKQRRFFKSNDLYELFTFKDEDSGITETSALFAGSGSEINLEKISKKIRKKSKTSPEHVEVQKAGDSSILLDAKKIEKMKKLARMLSKKISTDVNASGKAVNEIKDKDKNVVNANDTSKEILGDESKLESNVSSNKRMRFHRDKKRKTICDTFEGEMVPHLVNKLEYKECSVLKNEYKSEQDDYILKKLFSKAGISTAMLHDRIMEKGPADYALVEAEAEKVAKEAVRALKDSRRQYFHTDNNRGVGTRPRFGLKSRKKSLDLNKEDGGLDSNKIMSSSELLSRMKERNRLLNDNESIGTVSHSNEQLQLLTDIRNFISFEAGVHNVASTQEIIERFKDKLPSGTSPVFRALLLEICEFYRNADGKGMWRLRPDFRWC